MPLRMNHSLISLFVSDTIRHLETTSVRTDGLCRPELETLSYAVYAYDVDAALFGPGGTFARDDRTGYGPWARLVRAACEHVAAKMITDAVDVVQGECQDRLRADCAERLAASGSVPTAAEFRVRADRWRYLLLPDNWSLVPHQRLLTRACQLLFADACGAPTVATYSTDWLALAVPAPVANMMAQLNVPPRGGGPVAKGDQPQLLAAAATMFADDSGRMRFVDAVRLARLVTKPAEAVRV